MAFDWFWDIDWGGVLKGALPIAGQLAGGLLGQRGREEAYRPAQPGYATARTVPYDVYGDPTAMEARMRGILGGPAMGGVSPLDPMYETSLQQMISEGMGTPSITLSEYLDLVDARFGPQISKAQEQAITQTLEKIKPELVGRHGQAGPVIARYAREAGLPLEQAGAAAALRGPQVVAQIDEQRKATIQNAIKAGMAAGLSRQQIEVEVGRINQGARQALAQAVMESYKRGAGTISETRGGIPADRGIGEYDWLAGLDWGKMAGSAGGLLSSWLGDGAGGRDAGAWYPGGLQQMADGIWGTETPSR